MSLAQGNNTPTRPRIEPGSPDPESDALTTRPVRPPKFLYVHDLGPRSSNDLDLQYSHTFIYSFRRLLLPTFRSLAAIVSEKSTVYTFSYRKAYVTKGPESIRGVLALDFWKMRSSIIHVAYTHIIKAICHSNKTYTQTSVCLLSVAMETDKNDETAIFSRFSTFFCYFRSFELKF